MTYLTPSHFRSGSLHTACVGLALSVTEASDAQLTTEIASQSVNVDQMTNDHFETETLTLDLNVDNYSSRLYLPKRCRVITSINTRDDDGVLTLQPVTSYRLQSSLNVLGDLRMGDLDWVEILSSGLTSSLWYWPLGTQTVQVAGTFSWLVTPTDIQRAVARLVWEHFKERRPDVDRAETLTNAGVSLRFLQTDDDHPAGIREVDQVVQRYYRWSQLAVG